ncbi:MAG: phosphotransferase, partial [Anaerolineae bacterium]
SLQGTGIPVPEVYWLETDPRWLERPFFVMSRVKGETSPQLLVTEIYDKVRPKIARQKVEILARILLPILGWLPISFLYPIGEKQEVNMPKWEKYYRWASIIAGDFLYIKRHMPLNLEGKVIVTNTTTLADVELLTERGVRYLVTTTPRLEGRSFGTNVMEAALVAVSGKGRELTAEEIEAMLIALDLKPTIERVN